MSAVAKMRKDIASVRGSTSSSVDTGETCVSKNLNEAMRLQSERGEKRIREATGKHYKELQIAKSSAPWLAKPSAELLYGRNE